MFESNESKHIINLKIWIKSEDAGMSRADGSHHKKI